MTEVPLDLDLDEGPKQSVLGDPSAKHQYQLDCSLVAICQANHDDYLELFMDGRLHGSV